jgi:hypothetical protein
MAQAQRSLKPRSVPRKAAMAPKHDVKPFGLDPTGLIDDDWPEVGVVVDCPRRAWFRTALVLMLAAIVAETVQKRHAGAAASGMAQATQALCDAKQFASVGMHTLEQAERAIHDRLRDDAFQSAHRSGYWGVSGMAQFVLAIACCGVSRHFGERGSPVLFSFLSIAYVLWLMVLV